MQIAIDGPAGAGKSSVAQAVAHRLGVQYLDTGAMYRAVTLKALKEGADFENEGEMAALAQSCDLEVQDDGSGGNRIFLDGEDVTEEIRSQEVNRHVSLAAKSPALRKELVHLQREVARKSGRILMEGRDIGTNVLVGADYKFFLSASVAKRAERRWLEVKEKGKNYSYEDVLAEISERDRIDQGRKDDPLKIAPDAIVIDTTPYTLNEVIQKVLGYIKGAARERGNCVCYDEGIR